jgi:hypothetical protein
MENRVGTVSGDFFNVGHHLILVEIGLLSDLAGIHDGQSEQNAKKNTENGGNDFLRFHHKEAPFLFFIYFVVITTS